MSYDKIVTAVEKLSDNEKEEIFKMIHNYGCNYTKNNNGIFVNLAWLSTELLYKIEKYIEFCTKSEIEIKKYESLCDIFNNKLNTDNKHDHEHEGLISSKELEGDTEVETEAEHTISNPKLTATAKFLMYKKKFSKLYISPCIENELTQELL